MQNENRTKIYFHKSFAFVVGNFFSSSFHLITLIYFMHFPFAHIYDKLFPFNIEMHEILKLQSLAFILFFFSVFCSPSHDSFFSSFRLSSFYNISVNSTLHIKSRWSNGQVSHLTSLCGEELQKSALNVTPGLAQTRGLINKLL